MKLKELCVVLGVILFMFAGGIMVWPLSALIGAGGLFFFLLAVWSSKPRKKFYCGTVDLSRSPGLRYRIEKRRR